MPQFNIATWPSQIFWLIVTFAVLYLLVWRVLLPRIDQVMETRRKKIDDDLARAERLKKEADAVLADYEKILASAHSEAAKVMKEVADAAAAKQSRRLAECNDELGERIAQAERRIADAVESAQASLRSIAVEVAEQATAKLLGSTVPKTEIERAVAAAAEGTR